MVRKLAIVAIALLSIGCAQFEKNNIVFRGVGGDVWIRSIASDNQQSNGESTNIAASTSGLPVEGIPEIETSLAGNGLFAGHSVTIEDVSGSVFIEEAANRNQGVKIGESLEKLFVPGDPFAVTEK